MGRHVPPRLRLAIRKAAAMREARTSVRAACLLPPATPLMVYAGRIRDDRGIGAVVDALPRLPKFHLAVVCPPADHAAVRALLARAAKAGVARRVHPVSRRRRLDPAFLASADLAVLGFERPDGDAPLVPAALDAYRAAGLTIVAGHARAVKEYLALHHAGEVFAPGSP
ncbi:glycosyl transferase family 1, partial [Asanoa sp. NPDC050611]